MSLQRKKKLGYSCWGFLGYGIADTPDGGRSHRKVLIDALIASGIEVIMLQKNRDLLEADTLIRQKGLVFDSWLPQLDALFLEYRWPVKGRNCPEEETASTFTPDLVRQKELLEHYQVQNIPILIWDKDQKISSLWQGSPSLHFFEAALFPKKGRKQLLFPVAPKKLQDCLGDLGSYKKENRHRLLIYIGNQYERDESFKKWIDAVAQGLFVQAEVYGNWTKYPTILKKNLDRFPHCIFHNRVRFDKVPPLYQSSFSTVLIAPKRYYKAGQFTQRLFEAVENFCFPITPACYQGAEKVIIPELIVEDTKSMVKKIHWLVSLPNEDLRALLAAQLKKLTMFSVDRQVKTILSCL